MLKDLKFQKQLTSKDILQINPLNLAFIGDAVWTLLVRDYFCENTMYKNNFLHKLTTKFVKATYQSKALGILGDVLLDDEKEIARRARNTKINTASKNASLCEYKKATSFEAIIGYLFLLEKFERIKFLFDYLSKNFLEKN